MVWLDFLPFAADPTAGVNAHHGGKRPCAVSGHRQIEFEVRIAALAEDDSQLFMNRRAARRRRRDRQRANPADRQRIRERIETSENGERPA